MGITALFTLLATGIKSFFGFKQAQASTIEAALKVLSDVTTSNSEREKAIAAIISSEASSGYWLAACWRPIVAMSLFGLILASFFGFSPSHIDQNLSPMMVRIFDLFEICLYGYLPARTLEKIISNINLSSVLKKFVEKGIM